MGSATAGVKTALFFPLSEPTFGPNVANECPLAGLCDDITNKERHEMSKRDELIAKYADDLRNKCKIEPDMALLTKVTIGCGPAIYNADSSTVAGTDPAEMETVKKNFLMKKLGLADSPALMEAINAVINIYGKSERNKHRAVVYYMLAKHFGKESVYA
jgi:hypothetical protein